MSHVPRINESCHIYQWVVSQTWMSHVTQVHKLATPDIGITNRACDFFHESHARRAIAKSAAPQRWTACNSTSFGCVTYGCFPYAFLHELYISSRTACPSSKCKVYCSSVINSLQFYTIWVSHMHSFKNCIFCHEPHARKAIHGEEQFATLHPMGVLHMHSFTNCIFFDACLRGSIGMKFVEVWFLHKPYIPGCMPFTNRISSTNCIPVEELLLHMCDMTHSYVRHDSFLCVTGFIHICDMTLPSVWHDSSISVPWLIHMCDMTHPNVSRDSFICKTWIFHMCDMTFPYVCDITHS